MLQLQNTTIPIILRNARFIAIGLEVTVGSQAIQVLGEDSEISLVNSKFSQISALVRSNYGTFVVHIDFLLIFQTLSVRRQ